MDEFDQEIEHRSQHGKNLAALLPPGITDFNTFIEVLDEKVGVPDFITTSEAWKAYQERQRNNLP